MKGVVYAQYIIQCTPAGVLAHRTVILSPQQVAAFPPKINLEQVKSWGWHLSRRQDVISLTMIEFSIIEMASPACINKIRV